MKRLRKIGWISLIKLGWECFHNLALAYEENKDIDEAKRAIVTARDIGKGNEAILKLYDEIHKMD